jgi:hypothetical protein
MQSLTRKNIFFTGKMIASIINCHITNLRDELKQKEPGKILPGSFNYILIQCRLVNGSFRLFQVYRLWKVNVSKQPGSGRGPASV